MYLVDTNIWLERLLDQERSEEVGQFLARMTTDQLAITDFTLHSIGIVLTRLGRTDMFLRFIDDAFADGAVILLSIQPQVMRRIVDVMERFRLDFDDAYQYVAAEQAKAVIVSFDVDFDRTAQGRQMPMEVLRREDRI